MCDSVIVPRCVVREYPNKRVLTHDPRCIDQVLFRRLMCNPVKTWALVQTIWTPGIEDCIYLPPKNTKTKDECLRHEDDEFMQQVDELLSQAMAT